MKLSATIIFNLIYLLTIGQASQAPEFFNFTIDSTTNRIIYQEVVNVEGVSEDDLYSKAYQFFGNNFKSANHVLQVQDRAGGVIIGKGLHSTVVESIGVNVPVKFRFTLKVEVKDNRYRYTFTDINVKHNPDQYSTGSEYPIRNHVIDNLYKRNGKMKSVSKSYKIRLVSFLEDFSAQLKSEMKAETKSDW